jgi:hypothetical protein
MIHNQGCHGKKDILRVRSFLNNRNISKTVNANKRCALAKKASGIPEALVSERRDSNPRPQPWQGCALPAELLSQD